LYWAPFGGNINQQATNQATNLRRKTMATTTYTSRDLRDTYDTFSGRAVALCQLTREICGGQPADEDGLRAFVRYQLKLEDEQAVNDAVARIKKEELVTDKDITPELGEVQTKLTYGVCVMRHSSFGPWVGDWMVKACIKAAMSGNALFTSKRGTKRDVAEMGLVEAVGESLQGPPFQIHLYESVDVHGVDVYPAKTFFQRFKGSVSTPQGQKSIVTDHECVPAGSLFQFQFQWRDGKLTEQDIVAVFASIGNIGLGSVKAMERGKFQVLKLDVEMPGKK
jgi:hypothetical protein